MGMTPDMVKVFVYGTLKRGHGNYEHLLKGRSIFVDTDAINGVLFDLGSFPGALPGEGMIQGEIYMVGPKTLEKLDWLEGHPNFYKRTPIMTKGGHDVFVYFLNSVPKGANKIIDGIWPDSSNRIITRV